MCLFIAVKYYILMSYESFWNCSDKTYVENTPNLGNFFTENILLHKMPNKQQDTQYTHKQIVSIYFCSIIKFYV